MTLESVRSRLADKDEEDLSNAVAAIGRICGQHNLRVTENEIDHLLFALQCNAHAVVLDRSEEQIGLGLFPTVSMINHSCDPNCTHHFVVRQGEPPTVCVGALRRIAVGEEICYSYVPLLQDRSARARMLQMAYGFDCTCRRCLSSTDHILDDLSLQYRVCKTHALSGDKCKSAEQVMACVAMYSKNAASTAAVVHSKMCSFLCGNTLCAGLSDPCHPIFFDIYRTAVDSGFRAFQVKLRGSDHDNERDVDPAVDEKMVGKIAMIYALALVIVGYVIAFAGTGHWSVAQHLQRAMECAGLMGSEMRESMMDKISATAILLQSARNGLRVCSAVADHPSTARLLEIAIDAVVMDDPKDGEEEDELEGRSVGRADTMSPLAHLRRSALRHAALCYGKESESFLNFEKQILNMGID